MIIGNKLLDYKNLKGNDSKVGERKINAQFFRQPKYYSRFSCMGGSCPVSCCIAWRVDWDNNEIEKLRKAECSDHLRELIDTSFVKIDDEKCAVKMTDKGRCPFLTEDNFCQIQKELGEEYLSYTCRTYPRHSIVSGNYVINYCNLSCCRVMDMLCSDSDCMKLENHTFVQNHCLECTISDKKMDLINHPELKFRHQLFEFFYEILSDESHSLETSIILGALAAQKLSEFIDKGMCDRIPEIIKAIKPQICNEANVHNVEQIKPHMGRKFIFAIMLNNELLKSDLLDNISENGEIMDTKYIMGAEKFNKAFADRPFALRNIALNLWLELKMPFMNNDFDLFNNYCYFTAAVAEIKFLGAAIFAAENDPEKTFMEVSAYVVRALSHNSNKVKNVVNILKDAHCTSPAYIAAIIK